MAGRAVVIGGGIAGLLAAKALARYADTVTLVERDAFPELPEHRAGVPQDHHPHVLLSGGQHALDALLPGAAEDLARAGARRLDLPRDLLTCAPAGWQRRFDEGRHALISCTRPLLDHVVRRRVLAELRAAGTPLDLREDHEVTGLLGDFGRVTGIRLRARGGAETELPAEFVVDASGRSSRTPRWLAAMGRRAPREETVDAGFACVGRLLRLPDPPATGVAILPRPGTPRGGLLLPVERDRWQLTLYGARGHQPPTDEAGFTAFTATLADPYLHRLLRGAQPLGPARDFGDTANRRRHYDEPGALPDGLLVLADAACALNPLYGQGLSVAALGALTLHATLVGTGLRADAAPSAQRAVARTADAAWLIAATSDGAATGHRLGPRYLSLLTARAGVDPVVGAALRDVTSLTTPPERLTTPAFALRALLPPPPRGHRHPPQDVEPLP